MSLFNIVLSFMKYKNKKQVTTYNYYNYVIRIGLFCIMSFSESSIKCLCYNALMFSD